MNKSTTKRRDMLKRAALLALTGTGAAATQGKLSLINAALATGSSFEDYRALVCVFLFGGSDSFNMFVPYPQAEYDVYRQSRQSLAVDREALITGPDASIGFNPNLPRLRQLYDSNHVALVSNVGNLIAPITRQEYLNESGAIPSDLFAHDQQQEQWQKSYSSRPAGLVDAGWGGRMADILDAYNISSQLPPSFTVAGTNYWSPGNRTMPVSLHRQYGLNLISQLDSQASRQNIDRENSLAAILNLSYQHPMAIQVVDTYRRARDSARALSVVLDNSPDFQTPYDNRSSLGQQLRMVARLIAGRQSLGIQRQVFFVGLGGWDTHDNQAVRLPALLRELDSGLADFQASLTELGIADGVTTFTASDFGRTLTVNGDGTDHGWGGHYLVMGNQVRGGRLYGDLPSYVTDGPDDAGDKGRVIPQLSTGQYGAALASWMGLSDTQINDVFPDLRNFNDWRGLVPFMA